MDGNGLKIVHSSAISDLKVVEQDSPVVGGGSSHHPSPKRNGWGFAFFVSDLFILAQSEVVSIEKWVLEESI